MQAAEGVSVTREETRGRPGGCTDALWGAGIQRTEMRGLDTWGHRTSWVMASTGAVRVTQGERGGMAPPAKATERPPTGSRGWEPHRCTYLSRLGSAWGQPVQAGAAGRCGVSEPVLAGVSAARSGVWASAGCGWFGSALLPLHPSHRDWPRPARATVTPRPQPWRPQQAGEEGLRMGLAFLLQ